MNVWVVQHLTVHDTGDEDVLFIGVYSSNENAENAVERLKLQPGFCDTGDGFSIDPYTLDQDNWTEGFVTTHHPVGSGEAE